MIKVNEVIVVEGRYDKNTLSQFLDATIVETGGFGVFSDKDKLSLLRRLAEKRGLVILTDSDGAGFVIRNYLKGALPADKVKHAYIPDINGKERRKAAASKEGKLGVEGMSQAVIIEALQRANVEIGDCLPEKSKKQITKADMCVLGLSGGANSAARRAALIKKLKLPERLSPNALLDVLNLLVSPEELREMVNSLNVDE